MNLQLANIADTCKRVTLYVVCAVQCSSQVALRPHTIMYALCSSIWYCFPTIHISAPYYYLPKMENYLEARLWNDVFNAAQVCVMCIWNIVYCAYTTQLDKL
jgi:malate synthase